MTALEDDALQAAGEALSGARHFPHDQASAGRPCVNAPVDARSPAIQHAMALRQALNVLAPSPHPHALAMCMKASREVYDKGAAAL